MRSVTLALEEWVLKRDKASCTRNPITMRKLLEGLPVCLRSNIYILAEF
jgi:hypothetical protein